MKELLVLYREIVRVNFVVILLLLLVLVEGVSLAFFTPSFSSSREMVGVSEPTLRISEIKGSLIDSRAAAIVLDEKNSISSVYPLSCSTLPTEAWVFLLFAYIALLVYNFSFTFKKATSPQWFWETLYTVLALVAWYVFDGCQTHIWFPLMIIKTGLIIFIFYVYLLERKKSLDVAPRVE